MIWRGWATAIAVRYMKRLLILCWVAWVGLSVSRIAEAYESRLDIDSRHAARLDDLARQAGPSVGYESSRGVYRVDASWVLKNVSFGRLVAASFDFDHYREMGMPNVLASRIVDRTGAYLYTWTFMRTAGQESRHYLEVRVTGDLPSGGAANEWQLTPKRSSWPEVERPAFTRLDGSWYMLPLPNGNVYVRYFLVADFATSIPDFLVEWVAESQLKSGVSQVIQRLAQVAAVRQ